MPRYAFSQQGTTLTVTAPRRMTHWVGFSNDGSQLSVRSTATCRPIDTSGSDEINNIVFNGVAGNNTIYAYHVAADGGRRPFRSANRRVAPKLEFHDQRQQHAAPDSIGKASDTANMTDAPGANTLTVTPSGEQFEGSDI